MANAFSTGCLLLFLVEGVPEGRPTDGGAGPCWHVDLGLLTVMPVGSWPAMILSHKVGET